MMFAADIWGDIPYRQAADSTNKTPAFDPQLKVYADLQTQRLSSCTSLQPSDPMAASYCLGLAKFGTFYGHTGEIPGFNTFMGYYPKPKTTSFTWPTTTAAPDRRAPASVTAPTLNRERSNASEVPSEGRP